MKGLSLDQVGIHGFRNLKSLTLEGIGRLNIVVGANNSGKTSVLEALSIISDPLNPYEWLAMIYRRDFGGLDETRIQSLRWCFTQRGELSDPEAMFEAECEMSCEGNFALKGLKATYKDIVGEPDSHAISRLPIHRRQTLEERNFDEPWRGAELTHDVTLWAHADKPQSLDSTDLEYMTPITIQLWEEIPAPSRILRRRYRLKAETLTPYSYQINRLQVRSHSRHLFDENRDLVLDLINAFDPDIEDIDIGSLRGGRPAIYLKHRQFGPAPLSVFGDALRRAVLLASTLPQLRDGGLLLIDEIETGIHISSLHRVFTWLSDAARELNVQVFATTHSLEAVDAIAQSVTDRIDDLVTFHLKQTERETIARRIPGELLLRLRCESGLDVR